MITSHIGGRGISHKFLLFGFIAETEAFRCIHMDRTHKKVWFILQHIKNPKSSQLICLYTVSWAQFKQVGKSQSRDYQNMMGDTTLDHYHHIWKSYQIGSCMKIFKKTNFHFISHIFIWKQHHLWTIECELLIFSHSIVHRWHCFHMKIWDIKWKIRVISDLTFLASKEFSKINELSNNHVQTKTHHISVFRPKLLPTQNSQNRSQCAREILAYHWTF